MLGSNRPSVDLKTHECLHTQGKKPQTAKKQGKKQLSTTAIQYPKGEISATRRSDLALEELNLKIQDIQKSLNMLTKLKD